MFNYDFKLIISKVKSIILAKYFYGLINTFC